MSEYLYRTFQLKDRHVQLSAQRDQHSGFYYVTFTTLFEHGQTKVVTKRLTQVELLAKVRAIEQLNQGSIAGTVAATRFQPDNWFNSCNCPGDRLKK